MYLPEHFRVYEKNQILSLIKEFPLALVIGFVGDTFDFAEIPLIYQSGEDEDCLYGHMARANPLVDAIEQGTEFVCVFRGPNAYVSPLWIADNAVPTWNYASVKVRVMVERLVMNEELWQLLQQQTSFYDDLSKNWFETIDEERRSRILSAIVGVRFKVMDIEAKFKLSQNRSKSEQSSIISKLAEMESLSARSLSEFMKHYVRE